MNKFWYSKKQHEHVKNMVTNWPFFGGEEPKRTFVNGIEYTECTTDNKNPTSNFEDFVLVHEGEGGKITFKNY